MPVPGPAYRRLINTNGTTVSVQRRDTSTSSQYGTGISYNDLGHRRVLVAGFQESHQQTTAGERQTQRMTIYAEADTDLQVNDRLTIGNETYEIVSAEELRRANASITRYELDNEF